MTEGILRFFGEADHKWNKLEEGIERVIYTGDNMQVLIYRFAPGRKFPDHAHEDNEQLGFLMTGRMGFSIDGEERILAPGDFYRAPAGAVHSAWTLDEESVLVDVFSPPRTDLPC